MTIAKNFKRFGWWEKFNEGKFEDIKKILSHVSLYVGLIVYTALGGLVRKHILNTMYSFVYAGHFNIWM